MTSPSPSPSLEDQVKKQVEFYFGDSNFPRDKFLLSQSSLNPEGYIPVATIASFNKMKQLTTDVELIVKALQSSTVVKVSPDGKMFARIAPVPKEDLSTPRTIYAKGFPADTTIEKVSEFYTPHGAVASVRLRRFPDKTFKGSVFVEFVEEATAKKVLETKPKYNDTDLLYFSKDEYVNQKKDERAKKDQDRKEKKRKQHDEDKEDAKKEATFEPGMIIKVENVGDGVRREDLKALFEAYGKVEYVDFTQNSKDGFLRFSDATAAAEAVKKVVEEKKELGGQVPALKVLEGDEEKAYWEKVQEDKKKRASNSKRGGGSWGGRGGRGGGRGGRGGGFKKKRT